MFHFLLLLLLLTYTNSTLLFKQKSHLNGQQDVVVDDMSSSPSSTMIIKTPHRLPHLYEDIIIDIPHQTNSLILRVTRIFEHPLTRSNTVTGIIIEQSRVSSTGTFILSCQLNEKSSLEVTCLGNIRPRNSYGIQYELRPDKRLSSSLHYVKMVNINDIYEPKLLVSEKERIRKHQERLINEQQEQQLQQEEEEFKRINHVNDRRRRLAIDDNDILDLFVVWTPEAEAVAGSSNAMSLYMDFIIDEANYVLENSEVELRMRIVHSMRMSDSG